MVDGQMVNLEMEKSEQLARFQKKWRRAGIFKQLYFRISHTGMDLLWFQYQLACADRTSGNTNVCSRAWTAQYGLPCKHVFLKLLTGVSPVDYRGKLVGASVGDGPAVPGVPLTLVLDDLDSKYRLNLDGSSPIPEEQLRVLRIQDPAGLPSRQRQRAVPDAVTQADKEQAIAQGLELDDLMDAALYPDAIGTGPRNQHPQPATHARREDNRRVPSHDEEGIALLRQTEASRSGRRGGASESRAQQPKKGSKAYLERQFKDLQSQLVSEQVPMPLSSQHWRNNPNKADLDEYIKDLHAHLRVHRAGGFAAARPLAMPTSSQQFMFSQQFTPSQQCTPAQQFVLTQQPIPLQFANQHVVHQRPMQQELTYTRTAFEPAQHHSFLSSHSLPPPSSQMQGYQAGWEASSMRPPGFNQTQSGSSFHGHQGPQ